MLRFLFNHFIRTVVKDRRGEIDWGTTIGALIGGGIGLFGGPGMAALGAGAGAGIGSMFGGSSKEELADDPLADIRAQLRSLSSEVPGLVAREKALIGERFGEARKTGLEGITENVRGERGFGASSIEDRLKTELIDKLARSQAEAELSAETQGLKLRAGILGQEGAFTPTEEEPTFSEQLLGVGGQLLGQQVGYSGLEKYFGEKGGGTDFVESISKRPGVISENPELDYDEFEKYFRSR